MPPLLRMFSVLQKSVPNVAMQTLRSPPAPLEQPTKWYLRAINTLSESFATSWSWVSEGILLEWPMVSIMVSAGVCVALASGLAYVDVSETGAFWTARASPA